MKSAIILQHKYFIPYFSTDLRCHHWNNNETFFSMEMRYPSVNEGCRLCLCMQVHFRVRKTEATFIWPVQSENVAPLL